MDSYENLPDKDIKPLGEISKKFLDLRINTFRKACEFVHNAKYGYNSDYDDRMIFFKEKMGTCTTKHAVIAGLAEELDIPLYKYVGIYKYTDEITPGVSQILKKYNIPYIPMVHCYLVYKDGEYQIDLTEGNDNGKIKNPQDFIHSEKVEPFISRKDEYLLLKRVLKEKILPSEQMKDIKERTLLKAREEGIIFLKQHT
ncbi:MAG: hypothetical protein P8Y70_07945 [Candidatus Lokiarchaeota archaeon]